MGYLEKASMMAEYSLLSTLICLVFVSSYAVIWRRSRKVRVEDLLLMFSLITVSSLRYGLGSDYMRYLESAQFAARRFSDLHLLFSFETLKRYSFEVGYETLAVLSSRISGNQYVIFWVVSIILYIPIVLYCRKHTDNSRAAVAIFFLFGFWGLTLNIMKQAVAMVLVLYIHLLLKHRHYFPAAALTVIAMSFHISSLLAVAGIVVIHFGIFKRFFEPTRRNLWIMIALGIVLRYSTQILIGFLGRFSLYAPYLQYANAGVGDEISRKFIWIGAFLETVFVCVILYMAIKRKSVMTDANPRIEEILSIVMLGIPFSIMGISRTLWLANRFAKFFFLFLIALVPTLLGSNREKNGYIVRINGRLAFWCVMIVWHALYAVLMLDNNKFLIQTYLFR